METLKDRTWNAICHLFNVDVAFVDNMQLNPFRKVTPNDDLANFTDGLSDTVERTKWFNTFDFVFLVVSIIRTKCPELKTR